MINLIYTDHYLENTKEVLVMADHEKKILKALLEIEKTVEKLDETLCKLDDTDGKVKQFIEQEKAIHEIKKIARAVDRIDKYEDKDAEKWAKRIAADIEGQEKALVDIAVAADQLDEELAKVSDDDGKVKSFIAQKKIMHQVKKILHKMGLYEAYAEDELDNLI